MMMTDRALGSSIGSIALLSAWLGAAILVATVVAPASFAVLPSRAMAGALVGRVLPTLFWSGAAIGLASLALTWGLPGRIARGVVLLSVAAACLGAQLVVAPRIEHLRRVTSASMDSLTPSDPRRIAFGRLHGVSVGLLGVAALAAGVALILLARPLMPGRASQMVR